MNSDDEIIVVVDDNNHQTGSVPRSEMRQKRLTHRASYILVFNRAGELFIQKRTTTKDIYPGYYDVAAGGVVLAGETYEESAERELFEELGIVSGGIKFLFDHFYRDQDNSVWGRVFSCVHEGPFVLQKEEVEIGFFVGIKEVFQLAGKEPFTPDGLEILRKIAGN